MKNTPPSEAPISLPESTRVLACRVFQPELTFLGLAEPQIMYLDQGLHIHIDSLRDKISESISKIEEDPGVSQIILAYGYCGGGLEGLSAQRASLVVPLIHDCIPLLKGSPLDSPDGRMQHSFYLSAGWVDNGRTPLVEYLEYSEKLGEEDAMWVAKEMLKGYSSVTLIEHQEITRPEHHAHASEVSKLFDLEYRSTPCDLVWLLNLLLAQPSDQVMVLEPGQRIELKMFLNIGQTAQVAGQMEK
jgi:hypothetical protein